MADLNLGIDNAYNARLRQRLRELDQFDVITHNPQILGGGPVRKFVLAGNNGAYPMDQERLTELSAMGGAKFNLGKDLRPVARVLKSKEFRQIAEPVGKALLQAAVQRAVGGKINRLKKATRWTNYAADTANKGLDLASKGATVAKMFGFGEFEAARKVVRKALKDPLVRQAVSRQIPVVRRAVQSMTGGRPPSDRAAIVKQVMAEKGYSMTDASGYVKRMGLYDPQKPTKRPPNKRAAIVKQVMAEKGYNMTDASGYVKRMGLYDPQKPKAPKRPPSERALIVKQVMAERGLKMIDASKYVKANGLYVAKR